MTENCRKARLWLAKHYMPYVCVFSSQNTQQRMMDVNGLTPAEFLRPFGEVGNLNNYLVKTIEKNQSYKFNNFRVNFIDSQSMWDQQKKYDQLPFRILRECEPSVKRDIAENMPKTKEQIHERLLGLIGRNCHATEKQNTPWFTHIKQQFYQSERF